MSVRALGLGACLLACAPQSTHSVPPTTTPSSGESDTAQGTLEGTIPLLDGGTIDLAEMRGRSIVLAIGVTADPAFAPILEALRSLAEGSPAPVIVLVALDPEAADVPRSWPGPPDAVVLGWDPQGALATRLQVASLPSVIVLDKDGRVLPIQSVVDEESIAAIRRASG